MKRVCAASAIIAVLACSCASLFVQDRNLTDVKADMVCVPYEKGMRWDNVYGELGRDPDIIGQSGSVGKSNKYSRGYKNVTVILNIEKEEIREGKTVRFPEVVTGLELCRKK